MLDPQIQADILRLHYTEKLSYRAIASKLGIHRATVRALVRRRSIKIGRACAGTRPSILDPYRGQIDDFVKIDPQRSAVNILQRLRSGGYKGGITILRDYLRSCRPASEPKAYLSLEFLPGQAAQVDWGDFGDPFGLGRKLWCFVMVLCFSRLLYVEFTLSANFESFIRCHEHAFLFFGGIPKELWYDNLATAVAERIGKIIRFNPRFLCYAVDRGFKPVACNLASGHEKGRVEDGVRYLRYNFWPGRTFIDAKDTNTQCVQWRDVFANKRLHASIHKVPELVFENEKPHLLPLPIPYDTDEVKSAKASHQFFVSFDANEYSVPWRLSERILTVRANQDRVNIFLADNRVASHERSWAKNTYIENPHHKDGLLERKPGAQDSSDITALKSLGPMAERYLLCLGAQTRSLKRELKNLMVFWTVFGPEALYGAMEAILKEGVVGSEYIERILARSKDSRVLNAPPLELSDERLKITPKIPNLQSYDALLFEGKHKEENNAGNTQAPGGA